MSQGLFAGATSYQEQSLEDINIDIDNWIKMSNKQKNFIESKIEIVKKSGFWNKVDRDFVAIVYRTLRFIGTIIHDLSIINEAISQDNISQREVDILSQLGENLGNLYIDFRKSYKHNSEWKEYNNNDFIEVQAIYMEGGDYIATLLDISNVVDRIKYYMKKEQSVNNNINITGNVSGVQIQQGTSNSTQILKENNVFDYERVTEILQEIKLSTQQDLFDKDFAGKSEETKRIIDETIELTRKKENSKKVTLNLNLLKDLAVGIPGSVIASGIYELIKNLLK